MHFVFALLVSAALSSPAWAEDEDNASDGLKVAHQASSTTKDMSDAASNLSDTVKTIKGGGGSDGGSGGDASDASSDVQSALQSLSGQRDSGGQEQSSAGGEWYATDGRGT